MKNLLIILLFLGLVFWSCEDEEAASDVGNDSIIGSWNFTATEYDSTCIGDGELVGQGTMAFNETDVIVTNIFSFNYRVFHRVNFKYFTIRIERLSNRYNRCTRKFIYFLFKNVSSSCCFLFYSLRSF